MSARLFGLCLVVGALVGPGARAQGAAPAELYNKTVVLTWTEVRTQRQEKSGEVKTSTTASQVSIYVSSTGRIFSRFARNSGRRGNQTENSPGAESREGYGAGQHQIGFDGGQLNIDTKMRSGARRIAVSFGSGYRGCRFAITHGKEDGKELYHRAMDGKMYFIISTDVSATACAIKDGNVFAVTQ
jgi:hypothetical protein